MSKYEIKTLQDAIDFYLRALVRRVVAEVRAEKNEWADRERAEHCGL